MHIPVPSKEESLAMIQARDQELGSSSVERDPVVCWTTN